MWRMKGEGHTHAYTHTRAYTSHTHLHAAVASLCVGSWPTWSTWRPAASAQAQVGSRPSIPVGVTLLFLVAQVPGSGSVQLGKGFLKGTSKPLGRPRYLLLSSLSLESLPCPASCRLHLGKNDDC